MNWSRKHSLIAGLALIAGVNAIALGGVAYNRSGDPDSVLRLSERELRAPYVWRGSKENSGLALRLQWRVLPNDAQNKGYGWGGFSYGGTPDWLDEAKMAALGFDIDPQARYGAAGQLPRDVLLVLEFNADAYQAALARARNHEADTKEGPKRLKEEQEDSSRLFVIDAGLDRQALRSRYADRSRYAIVSGQVRPAWQGEAGALKPAGYVSDVSVASVNVPLEMRNVFDGASLSYAENAKSTARYAVELAFGQRLEPWITAAKRTQPQ